MNSAIANRQRYSLQKNLSYITGCENQISDRISDPLRSSPHVQCGVQSHVEVPSKWLLKVGYRIMSKAASPLSRKWVSNNHSCGIRASDKSHNVIHVFQPFARKSPSVDCTGSCLGDVIHCANFWQSIHGIQLTWDVNTAITVPQPADDLDVDMLNYVLILPVYQWCGLRPSILGQDRSETKKKRSWSCTLGSWSCTSSVVMWNTIF